MGFTSVSTGQVIALVLCAFFVMCLEKGYSLDPNAALSLGCKVGKVREEKSIFLHRCFASGVTMW